MSKQTPPKAGFVLGID